MDDSEKDELKSTLYDKNENSSSSKTTETVTYVDKNNKKNQIIYSEVTCDHGRLEGSQNNKNRIQQIDNYRTKSSGTYQVTGSNNIDKQKTNWANHHKFQLQSTSNQAPISKTNTNVTQKRYTHQIHQLISNSRVSEKSPIENNQYQNDNITRKNRSSNVKRVYDVNEDCNSKSNTKIHYNTKPIRTNNVNNSCTTESTSVDHNYDETNYGKETIFIMFLPF